MTENMLFNIGDRLVVDEEVCTVRFFGIVEGTKGNWLGVEWDNPKRGKHSGEKDGKFYFKTHIPNAGSFVRPRLAHTGNSLMTALNERYGIVENGGVDKDLSVRGSRGRETAVEMVGAEKVNQTMSHLENLVQMSLEGFYLNSVEKNSPILKKLRVFDFGRCLLKSWEEVSKFLEFMPSINEISVSSNLLDLPPNPQMLSEFFEKVKVLVTNRMYFRQLPEINYYTWNEVKKLGQICRNLEELFVCFNNITEIDDVSTITNIKYLNLEGNSLADFNQVLTLSELPNLTVLVLNDTGVKEVKFPENFNGFSKLYDLYLDKNQIADWFSITELRRLPSLQKLKFSKNPLLTEEVEKTARQIIVAKLKNLIDLNRTPVTKVERRGSELDYLKIYGKEWRASGGHQDPSKNNPSKEFTTEHPRYQELIDTYDAPEDSELTQISTALETQLIEIKLRYEQKSNGDWIEVGSCKKKIPRKMTVSKLKQLAGKAFRIRKRIHLSYSSDQQPESIHELDKDNQEIDYFAVDTNDTVHVRPL
ncbi:DgyrCDS13896 [Dimorphilus gyrociliatus]|uniref:Tubulin-specific chaperone E n=1 Tax=Dimorphilus gyrociliatus TaxID=2664684 RepID=A0A7I8WC56_9ANNE|nr:DgyrCDS13896 [Dimorphilus gyrociliatus]